MPKSPVSLKDIAEKLNVSISTVSRALRNHPDISTELTSEIQQLANEWNYSPNPLAMGLLRQKTKTIGVVVPDLVTYFYASIISGIDDFAREKGYQIIIKSSYESYEKEKECINHLLASRVEGLIVCLSQETNNFSHFDKILENEIPLVFFDRVCRTSEFSSVIVDNREASKQITRHFIESGSRRIAFIAGPKHLNITKERVLGYKDGLKEAGYSSKDEILEYIAINAVEATKATQKLLIRKPRPDAIFGINDSVAFAAMKEIKRMGLSIPADISLVGFTDDFHATVVEPELTSILHPTVEMGKEAARLFFENLESKNTYSPVQKTLNTRLIIRSSSVK